MKTSTYIFVIYFVTVLISCGKSDAGLNKSLPDGIISSEEMTKVLVDVYIAETATGIKDNSQTYSNYLAKHYYTEIFKKHHTNLNQFKNSFDYYTTETIEMEKIMANVIDELSKMQSEIKNE